MAVEGVGISATARTKKIAQDTVSRRRAKAGEHARRTCFLAENQGESIDRPVDSCFEYMP
jgi:hypothetical protein